jgi:hypothetical protein
VADEFHVHDAAKLDFRPILVLGEPFHYTADDEKQLYTIYLDRWDDTLFVSSAVMLASHRVVTKDGTREWWLKYCAGRIKLAQFLRRTFEGGLDQSAVVSKVTPRELKSANPRLVRNRKLSELANFGDIMALSRRSPVAGHCH